MTSVRLFDLLQRLVLVTRDSARSIRPDIEAAFRQGGDTLVLDLSGVLGLTPSFFSEILSVIENVGDGQCAGEFRVVIESPPTELSSKFLAVGRAHGLDVRQDADDSSWVISGWRTAYSGSGSSRTETGAL